MMHTDPIARRVVYRYRRGVLGTSRVEYSDAGNIDAVAVKKLLRPTLGYLYKLQFRPADTPHTVLFDGLTLDGRLVRGRVVLHAAVRPEAIVSWGEVLLDLGGEARASSSRHLANVRETLKMALHG